MTGPRTLLSMIYHGTIPAYRDEMHHDIDQACDRFLITAQGFQRFNACSDMPPWQDVRRTGKRVEQAAFEIRNGQLSQPNLETDSRQLFSQLAGLLAGEICGGHSRPHQNGNPAAPTHFLEAMYHLVYSPSFRAARPANTYLQGDDLQTYGPSWEVVRHALLGTGPNECVNVRPATEKLCDKLHRDFVDSIWPFVW